MSQSRFVTGDDATETTEPVPVLVPSALERLTTLASPFCSCSQGVVNGSANRDLRESR